MKKTAITFTLLAVFAACADSVPPTTVANSDAATSAVEAIMAELSDPRTLEVSATLHGQTVEERIDHLTGLLQWFANQHDVAADEEPDTIPRIDTAFTMVVLEVSEGGPFDPAIPEMMSGKIFAYTKATLPGAITHVTKWDYDLYTDSITIPEHLRYEYVDAIPGNELFTEIGCFYQPNETGLPNERVDYWAYAKTHHVYVVTEPRYYREDQWTEDFEDTRNPTYPPELAGLGCGPVGL